MNLDQKKNKRRLLNAKTLAFAIIAIVLFLSGVLVGCQGSQSQEVPEGEGEIVNQYRFYQGLEDDVDFQNFWEVWDLVKDLYYKQPVSEKDMYYGAISGAVDALGDPYSVFFDPDAANQFNEELDGVYSGIGAEIGKEEDYIIVIAPLSGSPANAAGLMAGDYIIAVDGQDIIGATVDEAVSIIRGEAGTEVVLTLVRNGFETAFDLSITRGDITINSVTWELNDDGIMIVEMSMFNEDTTPLFREAAQEVLTKDVKGIVLDLRNNPGGLLTAAVNVIGFWLDDEIAVQEKLGDKIESYPANGFAWLEGIPTVVLVNGGTASGSEILAGALQDYNLATVIGEQTYGKGSVQEYYEFEDGSALKITAAEWLTALGRSINEIGITPDIIIEYTVEDYEQGRTPQLDSAISELKKYW